ncbi:PhzF family phenazine biosynthesis protein [Kitasatospora sp. NPDC057015]|uniref:PhzF family phenazine biosynthesis protein n=1 Tax=Kitasatospora sp. NPDC057015 TaxID=3346001 RepID=UPI0036417729
MSRPSGHPTGRRDLPVTLVQACLRGGGGGSPTAVLDEASVTGSPLTDDERRGVPVRVGTSHAVFLSDDRDRADSGGRDRPEISARFFTAKGELPACGHGTVAALAFLAERADGREYRATLRVSGRRTAGRAVREASSVEVAFEVGPVALREPTAGELALILPALRIPTAALAPGVCIATLGRPRLIIPVTTRSALAVLDPAPERLSAACDRLGLLGCFVHSPMAATGRVAARMFAPSIGVPEDIANANSSACLAAHLVARQGVTGIAVDMGDAISSPSTVTARPRHTSSGPLIEVISAAKTRHVLRLPG